MELGFKEFKKSEILKNHLNLGGSNPKGERIDVTSLYLTKNGRPVIPVMGEYHFSRANRNDWHTELLKMKAGGIGIVATYLFWIQHEEVEGEFDFSGDLDIRAFVLEAQSVGMEVVLRVGPWAHGEARNGGLPDWIVKASFANRTDDPEYLPYVERWYQRISDEVKGLFYKDGGNIIAVQLDNELVDNAKHLDTLKKIAIKTGLVAPLYTVTGWNSCYGAEIPVDEVLPLFGGYADAPWAEGTDPLPLSPHYAFYETRNDSAIGVDLIKGKGDNTWELPYERYPYASCEIGAGMQSTHHRRVVLSGKDVLGMATTMLGAGNNLPGYYMYHGGTNKINRTTMNETKATGYPNDYAILGYDFGTCLSEYGEVREQYRLLNLHHLFLNDFGHMLAPMEHVGATKFADENNFDDLRYCMRTDGEGGFIFVNNYQRHAHTKAFKNVVFNTGKVKFPKIDIKEDSIFMLPFNISLGQTMLSYATAELLCFIPGSCTNCSDGVKGCVNTVFFMEIPGVKPEFKFADGNTISLALDKAHRDNVIHLNNVNIVVVPYDDARYMRKIDGRLLIGEGVDLYIDGDEVKAIEPGAYTYYEWNNGSFEKHFVDGEFTNAKWEISECEPKFTLPDYAIAELNLESPRKITWKSIKVDSMEGFVEIDDKYDVIEIYADGRMVADYYYEGRTYRVPSKLFFGHECYLVMSELKNDIYIEPNFL